MQKQTTIVTFLIGLAAAVLIVFLVVAPLVGGWARGSMEAPLMAACEAAAKAAAPALQLESESEVAAALRPYAGTARFTYVGVKNRTGAGLYAHRASGLARVPAGATVANGEIDGELFQTVPVMAGGSQVGSVTLGVS